MSWKPIFREFERLAEAPGFVPRLRRLILDLAVRGLLVAQDSSDRPADKLIAGIIGAPRELPLRPAYQALVDAPVTTPPFPVPAGWEWTRLGRVSDQIQRGKSPIYSVEDGPPVVSQKCVRWEGLDLGPARAITSESLATYEPSRFLRDQDLLWNSTGRGTIGRVARVVAPPADLVCDSHVTLVRCSHLISEYVRIWLRSDHVFGRIEGDASGSTGQLELTLQMAMSMPLPLPPFKEQRRIVERVNELMALCDALEAAEDDRAAARDRLRATSLHNLVSPTSLKDGAAFFLQTARRMITKPEHVAGLRQAILDLAARGRLVAQDPQDEPAADLLRRIEQERNELLASNFPNPAEAKAQARKQLQQVVPNSMPPLPDGWQWATLMQCAALVVDCKNKTVPYAKSGVTLLRTTNIRNGEVVLTDHRFVTEETYLGWSTRYRPEPGDIIITREAPMGEVAKIPAGLKVCLGQRLMLARLIPTTVDPDFLVYSLRDSRLMDRVQDKPIGSLVEHLRVGGVETLLVALPPANEQRRIVSKVNELMAVCDALEQSLAMEQAQRSRLLESLLRDALRHAGESTFVGV